MLTLYAIRFFLGASGSVRKLGRPRFEAALYRLYNMSGYSLLCTLYGTAELRFMWEQFFAFVSAAEKESPQDSESLMNTSRHTPHPKILGLLAVVDPEICIRYLDLLERMLCTYNMWRNRSR